MRALITVVALLIPSLAMTAETEHKIIKTPDGEISTTTTKVEPVSQEIVVVDPNGVETFDAYAARGPAFVAAYLPGVKDPSLKDYDEAFRLWQSDKRRRYSEQQVVEILGACLGNKLVKDFNMEWVVVTDKYGTDYAVRARQYVAMSFPFSSVLKRIESGQDGFMSGVYHTIKASIEGGEFKKR